MKQINSGRMLGGLLDTMNRVSFFISVGNTVMIILTFYNTGGGKLIKTWLPWINMYWFLLLAFFLISLTMLFVYLVVTPSYFRFYSSQFYQHNSDLKQDIKKIKEKLGIDES